MRCDGRLFPKKPQRVMDRLRFMLRDFLEKEILIPYMGAEHKFMCTNRDEIWRSMTLLIKEPGTVEWLSSEVKEGTVVYDIGDNIGLYTILSGHLVGNSGKVYAFEPHAVNFQRLCRNIEVNGLADRVVPLSVALDDKDGFGDFKYFNWAAGASMNQYENPLPDINFVFSELKAGVRVDTLLEAGRIRPPDIIKLDVDGIESRVLKGMEGLLRSDRRPGTILAEIQVGDSAGLVAVMKDYGYELVERQATYFGKNKMQKRGLTFEQIAHNGIFRAR